MTKKLLIAVALPCIVAMLAASASAQAAPLWELGMPWHVLPANETETLKSKGSLVLFEVGKIGGAKCTVVDTELISNVPNTAGSLEGTDVMAEFVGKCFGASIFPCTAKEHFTIRGVQWRSDLTGAVEDEFIGPTLEVNCPLSGLVEHYKGLSLHPTLTVNKLTFAGLPSGKLEAGAHEIYFKGVDKLKPTLWKKVR